MITKNRIDLIREVMPVQVDFTTSLTFDYPKEMTAEGSEEDFVFTADLLNSIIGVSVTIFLPSAASASVVFSGSEFKVRRDDFDESVDCVAYCMREGDHIGVSILPQSIV